MKNLYVSIFILCSVIVNAQNFNSLNFDALPQNYQLYPRNSRDLAQIPVSGQTVVNNLKKVSLQIFREDKLIGYQKIDVIYSDLIGRFKFIPITIRAELAEYKIKIFAISDKGDSTQVVVREHIVAGDAFLIGGQSNALAIVSDQITPYRNKFARTFAAGYPYNPAFEWQLSEYGNNRVGLLGGGLQKEIIEKHKIPVCIINQAIGGINLSESLERDPNNVGSLSNNYGITYARVRDAGLLNGGIKAFIWRQGENESSGGSAFWGGLFDKLYKLWHIDYPEIKKYYIFQVGLIAYPERYAGALRDYQRRTKTIYNDVDNITCIGTQGYDGIHYDSSGHRQTARELFRMINRDFYGGKYTENVNSPNVQKVYFSKIDKTEITLEFEQDQKMVWVNDTILYGKRGNAVKQYMRNMFFFDGITENTLVTEGRDLGNKIIITLKSPPPNTKFNYLPSFHDDIDFQQFGGPFLKNKIGMRAFSFDQVTIGDYVPTSIPKLSNPDISVKALSFESIKVSWKNVPNATSFVLERKASENDIYKQIGVFGFDKIEFIDNQLKENTTYFYRLRALGDKTESEFVTAQVNTIAKLIISDFAISTISFQSLKISWKKVPNATYYLLERKNSATESYKEIARLLTDKIEFIDEQLKENSTFFYRIKAHGENTESDFVMSQAITPAKLSVPELIINVVSFESLKLTWNAVQNANLYVLERKSAQNESYKEAKRFERNQTEYQDNQLEANSSYFYRMKALGDKTESDYVMAESKTAVILNVNEAIIDVFTLYPNPASSQIIIKFSKPTTGQLSFIGLNGAIIFETDINKLLEIKIPIDLFARGIYFVHIKNESGDYTKKILIE